ncbi:hypothetical protein GYMLUDRAFT_345274 [Collybiopsis luxurians FD-317 M1]|nr:hypothetical protein GYMLUDRAFT_345274 [Collybiopsis luxurians FD-317 M1]
MSSNSNNISNTLSGIFRSMSRRGQPRGVQTEASNTQHRTDVDMDSQPNPSLPISDVDTAPLNNPSFPTDDGNQSDSSMPVLEDVSDSESDSDAGSLAGDMDVESFDAPSMNIRSQTGTVPSLVQHYDSVIFPDEDEDMSWLGSVQPLPFRPQGTRRARVEEDVEGDSERDRRHPSQRASNNSTPVPSNPGRSATPQVRLPQQQTSYPNSMGSRRHGRRHQHHLPMHFMTQMGIDVQRDSPNSQSPSQSNSASSVSQQASGRPEGNDRPTAHPASRISQLLESLFQAAGEGAGTIHTTVNGIPVTGNIPPADASAGSGGPGRFLGNLFAAMNAVDGGFPFFRLHPQEREDPERARILVEGLEDVPVGLLRRLERVSPESSGCAICWEKLLEDDAEYLKREEEQENKKAAECAAKADGTDLIESGSTTSNDAQVAGSSTETLSSQAIKRKIPKYPRIVTLPCAHLFHADCLVPWFTRPNQTTCPTCRFNIDPDNLTRGAGARRAATATVVEGETATETQSGDASLRDVPLTDDSFAIDPTSGMPVRSSDGNTDAAASVGFFRVLEGGLGGPTIVPVPPPSFVSNMGPFLNPPSRSSASWSQTASNSFANTATGGKRCYT